MELTTIPPRLPLLKKHIDFYYFFSSADPDYYTSYWAFPHTSTSLNIHKNIDYRIGKNSVKINTSILPNYRCIIQGFRRHPLHAQLEGILDKVTVVFKPLAINHFLHQPYSEVAPFHSQLFTGWNNDPLYQPFIKAFYSTQNEQDRSALLEDYFVSVFEEQDVCSLLAPAVEMLMDVNNDCPIEKIAAGVHQSVRTFNRMFAKYAGITPAGFRKVARFRHTLDQLLTGLQQTNMTRVAHSSNYCDQAYLVKTYRELTGTSPRSFMKTIQPLADKKVIFRFEELQ